MHRYKEVVFQVYNVVSQIEFETDRITGQADAISLALTKALIISDANNYVPLESGNARRISLTAMI